MDGSGAASEPPNKGMKQTKFEHIGASQLTPASVVCT